MDTELVLAAFDPAAVSHEALLGIFWEAHDPTQDMRQGNDLGTQYRSAIYTYAETQRATALQTRDQYQAALARAGYGPITTEIAPAPSTYVRTGGQAPSGRCT